MTARPSPFRLTWIDNLRILLMAMVVAHHAGQPYGPTGGFWPVANPTRAAILGPFFTVNAAFGMGLFFFIAGYFVPVSYDRKGARAFLRDRLLRLGLPLAFVSLVVLPLPIYLWAGKRHPFLPFLARYARQPLVLHLWFLGYLIVLSGGYVLWRWLAPRGGPPLPEEGAMPRHRAVLGYVLGLALMTFLVRIVFPIDRWVDLAPLLRVEPAYLPQYVSLFVLGILAARRDWLRRLPTRTGMGWLAIGLAAGALPYAATILSRFTGADISVSSGGGLTLAALVWSGLEAFIAVGLSIGLLTLFRDRVNGDGAVARKVGAAVYTVYLIHVFLVLGLQSVLVGSSLPPLAKFGAVTLIAVPLCFAVACGLRELPGVRRVV